MSSKLLGALRTVCVVLLSMLSVFNVVLSQSCDPEQLPITGSEISFHPQFSGSSCIVSYELGTGTDPIPLLNSWHIKQPLSESLVSGAQVEILCEDAWPASGALNPACSCSLNATRDTVKMWCARGDCENLEDGYGWVATLAIVNGQTSLPENLLATPGGVVIVEHVDSKSHLPEEPEFKVVVRSMYGMNQLYASSTVAVRFLHMHDLNGRLIWVKQFSSATTSFRVSMGDLQSGMYALTMIDHQGRRLVKKLDYRR